MIRNRRWEHWVLADFTSNEVSFLRWCDKTQYFCTCFSLTFVSDKKEIRPVKGIVVWSMRTVLVLWILRYWKPAILDIE